MILWVGFGLSLLALLIVSRRDLALSMGIAALVLGGFSLPPGAFLSVLGRTISDPTVLLLAFIVGVIPLIGGVMELSGEMDRLVANLKIGLRPFLAFAPALLGLLPMPGGALLSAPVLERRAPHSPPALKAAANVWFRHILLLVYPLGPSLIASARIAHFDVYSVIPYLMIPFGVSLLLGYFFILRGVDPEPPLSSRFSPAGFFLPFLIIVIAPLLDIILKGSVRLPYPEIGTAVGVTVSLILAMSIGRLRPKRLGGVFIKMRPLKYALIILAMFAFLNVFKVSGVPERIGALNLPPLVLTVLIGPLLGLITGRIQAPISIIVPIFVTAYGAISAPAFALTYFAVFLGYILTPVHPCISVSLEYFDVSLWALFRRMAAPAILGLAAAVVAALFLL